MKKHISAQVLIAELNAYIPKDIGDSNVFIDELLGENFDIFIHHYPMMLEPCFRFIERAIIEDFDCFSLIHILESDSGFNETIYLTELLNSANRKPTQMVNLMLNRMINGGFETKKCLEKLTEIANNTTVDSYLRKDALDYLDYQKENGNFI